MTDREKLNKLGHPRSSATPHIKIFEKSHGFAMGYSQWDANMQPLDALRTFIVTPSGFKNYFHISLFQEQSSKLLRHFCGRYQLEILRIWEVSTVHSCENWKPNPWLPWNGTGPLPTSVPDGRTMDPVKSSVKTSNTEH